MRRHLFNLAAGVSLLLCLATAALWIVSYVRACQAVAHTGIGSVALSVRDGRVWLVAYAGAAGRAPYARRVAWQWVSLGAPGPRFEEMVWRPTLLQRIVYRCGFASIRDALRGRPDLYCVPLWWLAALAAVVPFRRLRALLRDRRHRDPTHCPSCGYDCRATPEKCPECGTELEAKDEG